MLPLTGQYEFVDRLVRQLKERRQWASRNRVSCFRAYEKEEVGFPFIIDLYEDRLIWSVLTDRDEDEVPEELFQLASEATGIKREKIHVKARQKQRGKDQYTKVAEEQELLTVREGGLKFLVNLSDYLDTGLFLDHRWTRSYVRDLSGGLKVLNLFAYTGSFSVYAAHGGAFETTTVDLNQNYLDWAKKNFEANDLAGPRHRFLRRDVLEFLRTETKLKFDLIVLDPPTFSNSKKMDGTFDVQRDHPEMIARCLRLLNPDGWLIFSNNYQKFRFDGQGLPPCQVKEISSFTLPRDFKKTAHRAWLISHPGAPELQLKKLEIS
ncbi:MAG TPA: class I SAM-dependent methyltransferase [Spirochaetia bacterium]|nr:class I SAM-dependent methyltransferase [Spirochaetia bacterium]